jgi:hypothetical protein
MRKNLITISGNHNGVENMEQTLGYLREILSNYVEEQSLSQQIYKKLHSTSYHDEKEFVMSLAEDESNYLNKILPDEIKHSLQEQDYKRLEELNNVYELLL